MSATVDPAKLKVVELRQELSARGLDTKGNKAVLVKRLKDALEKELQQEIPDTSIADTSTEDFNTSQSEISEPDKPSSQKDTSPVPESPKEKTEIHPEPEPDKVEMTTVETVEEQQETPAEKMEEIVQEQSQEEETPEISNTDESKCEENGDKIEEIDEQEEPPNKKSRLVDDPPENIENDAVDSKIQDNLNRTTEVAGVELENESRGDKRKHSSSSPSRSQRRRSKSPIKEDEPVIDNNKVQLNWYDSDLHLQVDKESFLSARPYHDGAFGYIWAGVRATHGADSGKVCFEVKIIEELKWEDNIKPPERSRRERDRKDSKRERSDRDKKSEGDEKKKHKNGKKSQEKQSSESKSTTEGDDKEETETKPEAECQDENMETTETKTEEEKPVEKEEATTDSNVEENTSKIEKEDGENGVQENTDTENKTAEIKAEDQKEEPMEVDDAKPKQDSKEKEIPPVPSHLIRIGWSAVNTGLQLGEEKYSYAFESTGKFVTEKQFSEYGKTFASGDVIGAFVEFGDESIKLIFTVNGEKLPEAINTPRSELSEDFALFPHILSRNYVFEVNLGNREEPWFANPEELADFVYLDKLENRITGPVRPENRNDCEVIMMCGLPAAGKTHWVQEYIAQNNEKNYTIIGTIQLLERMTVNGNPLKNNLRGRWNVLLDRLTKSLNKLVEIAALRRRNYIIDQTNVFPSAQRRKMRSFEGFKRRAVIVVCGEEEQAKRRALQEAQDGKDVPDVAVLEMKANMSLPRVGDWLEEVTYVELNEQDAKAMVQKYNTQGKEAGYGPTVQRRDHRDDRFNKWQGNRRNDYRGNYRDRGYNNRFDRGQKYGGGWQNRNVSWTRNDRRDNRGPMGGSRDWRNRGSGPRHQDRGRDRDNNRHANRDSYNRSRSQSGSRNQGGNWQGGSNWGQSGNWSNWQGQGGGSWGGQGWGQTQGQGKWNYSQGYGQQGYGNYPNWNYYGHYQNWNTQQTQPQQAVASGTAATSSGNAQAWVQYAQQYAQSNTGQQPTGQK